MTGETDLLGVGFFGGIDMFMPVPKPLMLERAESSVRSELGR